MTGRSWKITKVLAGIGVAVPVIVLCDVLVLRLMTGFGVTFHESFNTIEPGMSEEEVVQLLWRPNERTAEFRLGQREGWEHEYARAEASGSEYYLLWHKGIDVVYAVGFDGDGKVTMKAVGGT